VCIHRPIDCNLSTLTRTKADAVLEAKPWQTLLHFWVFDARPED
jgi:hypothetical protein